MPSNHLLSRFVACFVLLAGCAARAPRLTPSQQIAEEMKRTFAAIICVTGEPSRNFQVEKEFSKMMRERGFQTLIARNLVPTTTSYRLTEMVERLSMVGVDSVADISYEDVPTAEGNKTKFHVEYFALQKQQPPPDMEIVPGEMGNDLLIALLSYLKAR